MKTIIIFGAKGHLGSHLTERFRPFFNVIPFHRDSVDLKDVSQISSLISQAKPDVIFNCIGLADADKAEKNREDSLESNFIVVKNIVDAIDGSPLIKFVTFSSDYVFNGKKNCPYKEEDNTEPLLIYGEHKVKAEQYVSEYCENYFIFRVSWLFSPLGNNFQSRIIKIAQERSVLNVVSDVYGSPTSTIYLANCLQQMLIKMHQTECNGLYHLCNSGVASWYDLAFAIKRKFKLECLIRPISREEFPQVANRPRFSVLNNKKFIHDFEIEIPHWSDFI